MFDVHKLYFIIDFRLMVLWFVWLFACLIVWLFACSTQIRLQRYYFFCKYANKIPKICKFCRFLLYSVYSVYAALLCFIELYWAFFCFIVCFPFSSSVHINRTIPSSALFSSPSVLTCFGICLYSPGDVIVRKKDIHYSLLIIHFNNSLSLASGSDPDIFFGKFWVILDKY